MRVIFLGTPDFALPSLRALNEKYEVVAVVCQPDREKDRKGNFIAGAVKQEATKLGLPIYQFEKIKVEGVGVLTELRPDVMVTCAYGQILSQEILDIAPYGVINVHGSLLPEYRGSAPIQRSLIDGKKVTGVTIMKTDVGMDSGGILSVQLAIDDSDYVDDLYQKLSEMGAKLLIDTLDGYFSGDIKPIKQDESKVTFAPPLKKEEAYIDFSMSAEKIRNIVRGFGYGVCSYKGTPVKIYKAEIANNDEKRDAGEVILAHKKNLVVACGKDALRFTELQMSGKKKMATVDFLNGVKISEGDKFETLN